MQARLLTAWEEVRSSYWFVPALMVAAAIALSFVLVEIDEETQTTVGFKLGLVWGGGPEPARGLLETVAGSMITVAGVTFSVTLVALSLTSSQFGPRLLRSFMRDTGNQVVLGTFIATFVYCLMVLRTIRSGEGETFVPALAITFAMVLALAGLGVLIYFVHHVSLSIQAPIIIAGVAADLFGALDRLFPAGVGNEPPDPHAGGDLDRLLERLEETGRPVPARDNGYLQAVDGGELLRIAARGDLILTLTRRPGHFVGEGNTLVRAWPEERVTDEIERRIGRAFVVGKQRTPTQDAEFAVDQLVEVAVRALSPGVNDPFTAITCIDWLGAALSSRAGQPFPSPLRYDEAGKLRLVIERPLSFSGLVDAAFNQIRQYAGASAAVRIRLLETIDDIAEHDLDEEARRALLRQARMIEEAGHDALPQSDDRADVDRRYDEVVDNVNDIAG